MENLDIIILTTLVIISFVIFIISTLKEIKRMEEEPYKFEKATGFSRPALFNVLRGLFEDDDIKEEDKEKFRNTLKRSISDMHTDGVYFDKSKTLQKMKSSEDNSQKGNENL
jgi:hypothetical protein